MLTLVGSQLVGLILGYLDAPFAAKQVAAANEAFDQSHAPKAPGANLGGRDSSVGY